MDRHAPSLRIHRIRHARNQPERRERSGVALCAVLRRRHDGGVYRSGRLPPALARDDIKESRRKITLQTMIHIPTGPRPTRGLVLVFSAALICPWIARAQTD